MKLRIKSIAVVLFGIISSGALTYFVIGSSPVIDNYKIATLIGGFALIFLITWGLGYFFILRYIYFFYNVTEIIAKGNLGVRVGLKTNDEIGHLSQNIDKIINDLTTSLQFMANSIRDEKKRENLLTEKVTELEDERARIGALMTSIGDGVIAINKEKDIILLNKPASDMTGFAIYESLGRPYKNILKIFTEKEQQEIGDFVEMVLTKKQPASFRHFVIKNKSDGKLIPITINCAPMIDITGRTLGVIAVIRDVTIDRQIDKLKDEFLSIASHELRTPMTAIKGLISMIFEGDYGQINNELNEPLKDIASSTDRLIQLVNDMLDVSRIEAGRLKLEIKDVSVREVVGELDSLMKPIVEQKGLKLEAVDIANEYVKADEDKFKQILQNLLGNSLKFTDKGFIRISTRVYNHFVYVSVTDSGLGISPEDKVRLFAKFQQISSVQEGRPPGSGLGLYLSKELARKMGGDLWIERTQAGVGTTFTFALPISYNAHTSYMHLASLGQAQA